ncbi:MAG TPA: hypothetical protein VE978_08540 [Chitinophagales bacterium]|nr:hypothetical protein [Chitinophagales bacterium]
MKSNSTCPLRTRRNFCWDRKFKSSFVIFFCLISYVFCLSAKVAAQGITATLKADSNHILIGDFLNLKLTVKCPNEFSVKMPLVLDTVGNLELVKASKIDTAVSGNFKTLSQTYTVSAYDSGKYHAGPQKIFYKDKSGLIDSIISDSVLVTVATVAVDTSKPIKIIKAPVDVPYTLKEFLAYIAGGVIVLAIISAGVYFIWRRRARRKAVVVERPKPKDPPHIWARKELRKLEEDKVWQKDEIKLYYSRLTTILRLYLEYRYNWFALESTTEEIEENIDSHVVSDEAKNLLLTILKNADLVKFAKMVPAPDVNVKVMESAYKFIDLTEQKEVVIGAKTYV